MFSIKIVFLAVLAGVMISGCSSRFPNSSHTGKSSHKVNSFNPYEADKTHKVRWNDQGRENGVQPQPTSDRLSHKTLSHPTMNGYKVNGHKYKPHTTKPGQTYKGVASWYGPDFNGRPTSNGETYDMYAYTAAHKTLPMHTIVRVTHLDNGKKVVVRINDRGPFVKGRIIDLSKAAAYAIDMTQKGTAPVKIEVLGFNENPTHISTRMAQSSYKNSTRPKEKPSKAEDKLYVQIGSFKNIEGAQAYKERYTLLGERYDAVVKTSRIDGDMIYKVALSGFGSEEEARDFIQNHHGFEHAFILRD